jgi:predicted TIM-barrel fold metal-dependent hydrolase
MKIFDFNIHLPIDKKVDSELIATNRDLIDRYSNLQLDIDAVNFMIFNSNLFDEGNDFIKYKKSEKICSYTLLVDFRSPIVFEKLERAIASGINFIKFHSYHQKITSADYHSIIKICKFAEQKNIKICLDASYGTNKMLKYDIIDFICTISDHITKTPIVILHSGGIKCLEVMLLALERSNIYIETSFTLPFYIGSTIEQDLAFMYKKVDKYKIIYGSDSPYVNNKESIDISYNFFERHKLSYLIDDIFYNNAINLLNNEI